jgi:hypothetical protein
MPSEGSDVLFCGQVVVEFRDPLQFVELHFVFPNAQFPHAGEYRFQLCAGGSLVRERKFLVRELVAAEGEDCCP